MSESFMTLDLHPNLIQAVKERGYQSPTPIQSAVIPLMLSGQDVIGQSKTGTGKTAAFGLPVLQKITSDRHGIQPLLTPTRELATQVAQTVYQYGQHKGVRVLAVYGGQPYEKQIRRIRKGVDVVVGTPGRLLDLIRRGVLDLSKVQTLVLDEADEMLSMGFIEDIESILSEIPAERQTTLFSATVPAEIRRLANQYIRDPEMVKIQGAHLTVDATDQHYYVVNHVDKLAALTRLFEMEDMESTLIFVRTRISSGELASELTGRGFPAEALNGDLSQDSRDQVMNRFRRHQSKVLVATDVAARGLDIDDISHVVNFDLPQDPEVYVHRIGRTGRAGKSGTAITILTPKEMWRLRQIERFTHGTITKKALPTIEEIQQRREDKLLEEMMVWLRRDRCRREKEIVEVLAGEGYDPYAVAAAALKMARAEEKQRPIAPIGAIQPSRPAPRPSRNGRNGARRNNGSHDRRRSHESGMVRLTMAAGKHDGVRPNDVVGSIAHYGNIPGHTIGAIRIHDRHTYVDVPEQLVAQVLDQASTFEIRRQVVTLQRA